MKNTNSSTFQSTLESHGKNPLIQTFLESSLINPLEEFYRRPTKKFRATLVKEGAHLCHVPHSQSGDIEILQATLEDLHNGSLIIDDIQDHEAIRRGSPALHHLIGTELAINSGSWLYFHALNRLHSLSVSEKLKAEIMHQCHQTLLKAHIGQGFDLKIQMNQIARPEIPEVIRETFKLKTGELTALAFALPTLLQSQTQQDFQLFYDFGLQFGISLQILDDLQDLNENDTQWLSGRPHSVWLILHQFCSEKEFQLAKIALWEQDANLILEIVRPFIPSLKLKTSQEIDASFENFKSKLNRRDLDNYSLKNLIEKLKESYV